MNVDTAKQMMDAFYDARRVRDLLLPLPEGIRQSYIHIIDVIHQISERQNAVRVSDVSDALGIPRPGVTRSLKEMEKKGLVQKTHSADDGRVVFVELTEDGQKLYQKYVVDYFNDLTARFEDIPDEDARQMIRTIHAVSRAAGIAGVSRDI